MVFKMATVRYLGFLKYKRSGCLRDAFVANFFCDYQDGGRCYLGFSKTRNFNAL